MSLTGGTGCHYQVEQGVITRWDVACGGVSLPGGALLVLGCHYQWDRVSLPGRTSLVVGCLYQVGQGVVTSWDRVLLPGWTLLVVWCRYQVGHCLW